MRQAARKMCRRFFIGLLFLCVVSLGLGQGGDDFQYRAALNLSLLDVGKFNFTTYGEMRVSDSPTVPFGFLVAPRLSYRLADWLTAGANYSFIESDVQNPVTGSRNRQDSHRLEFEINPGFRLTSRLRFRLRNRYEHRWLAGGAEDDRTRHRFEFYWEIPNWKPLKEIYCFDELFVDWTRTTITINRIMPLGLNWRINDYVGLRTFYFYEQRFGVAGRIAENSHVFYTLVDLRLKR